MMSSALPSPSVAVIRLYPWKYELFGAAGFRPMRSNRERMKSAAAPFSSVSVNRPRSESPARKKRSARRSSCRIESFCGASVAAATAAATNSVFSMARLYERRCCRCDVCLRRSVLDTPERYGARASARGGPTRSRNVVAECPSNPLRSVEIREPDCIVGERGGDNDHRIARCAIAWKVRREVDEEVGRTRNDERDFRQRDRAGTPADQGEAGANAERGGQYADDEHNCQRQPANRQRIDHARRRQPQGQWLPHDEQHAEQEQPTTEGYPFHRRSTTKR